MTDEELIARLRVDEPMCEEHFTANLAADRIEALIAERDHWSGVARREGVCMTCRGPNGAPETYGCTDCLNTGYCGEHHSTVADLEAKLATCEKYRDAYAEMGRIGTQAVRDLEAKLAECEARLGKAVEALKMMCEEFRGYDLPYGSKAYSQATAALAEIKGESHE